MHFYWYLIYRVLTEDACMHLLLKPYKLSTNTQLILNLALQKIVAVRSTIPAREDWLANNSDELVTDSIALVFPINHNTVTKTNFFDDFENKPEDLTEGDDNP